MSKIPRLRAMAKKVRTETCEIRKHQLMGQFSDELSKAISELNEKRAEIDREVGCISDIESLAKSEPAKLNKPLSPPEGFETVAVFDCGEVSIYYENAETDELIEVKWPFYLDFVHTHDCELHGMRIE